MAAEILFARAYGGDKRVERAQGMADTLRRVRGRDPHVPAGTEVRTYARTVRAGGAVVPVIAVVARRKDGAS